ncbi:MAG TPA: alpha-ketoacid dehydrogenase subunit beta [Deltaproteobacteria bacterium]|nr:alpha-ketoacid dehydrogenase subunit beta [Deltaproteobacteria bacterium]
MKEMTYRDALRLGLQESMQSDPTIVILGEEVGCYGGAYGVTKGLLDEFGRDWVRDTPISEEILVGAAVGAAMTGLRPVAELMYVDFITLAMDQLVNQAAKIRYMFGGQISVPMMLRSQGGTGRSAAAQHSQSLEAWVMHTPGLHLAVPADATDAYVLIKQALTLADPVVFLEHKGLYAQSFPFNPESALPWGRAKISRSGNDCSIICYSRMAQRSLDAAEQLAELGVQIEVIDLRTLHPLDMETVTKSIRKTGRALVVTEDCLTAGVSAELSARITEENFEYLEEPVLRLAGEDIPIPVAPALETASVPTIESIKQNILKLMRK